MKLIMVRHGETEANVKKLNQGADHGKLTKKGITQAKKTGKYLSRERIDFIYASDLKRTKDTLLQMSSGMKSKSAPIKFVKELRERNLGIFEGMPYGSFRKYVNEHGLDLITYRPENGESIKESDLRVKAFYNDCLKKHKGKTVLWVSHGSILKRLLLHALKDDASNFKDLHPSNCSVSIIEMGLKGKLNVPVINYTAHLLPVRKTTSKSTKKK